MSLIWRKLRRVEKLRAEISRSMLQKGEAQTAKTKDRQKKFNLPSQIVSLVSDKPHKQRYSSHITC